MADQPTASTRLRTALVYDFDGTLAPGSVQEHHLLPELLDLSPKIFWDEVKAETKKHDGDEILVYLQMILEKARDRGLDITRERLAECGPMTPFFPGVETWFERINEHAEAVGLELEHYIVSSGNEEIIANTAIRQHLKTIYASKYMYGSDGVARWPAIAINYTTKVQYLFRINKGVDCNWDNDKVNRWVPMAERPLPFSRMIYLGDGDTDIPSMKMVRHQGGHSVAVFDQSERTNPKMQQKVYNLIAENRADFVVPADYSEGSQLDITMKGILGRIARDQAGYRGLACAVRAPLSLTVLGESPGKFSPPMAPELAHPLPVTSDRTASSGAVRRGQLASESVTEKVAPSKPGCRASLLRPKAQSEVGCS